MSGKFFLGLALVWCGGWLACCGAENNSVTGAKDDAELITLATFNGTNGARPVGSLAWGNDGTFYGVTESGGTNRGRGIYGMGCGTVFRVTTKGLLTTLFSFNGTNGETPMTGLVGGTEGDFYGVTYAGGTNHGGVAFCITANGNEKVLHDFGGGDGWDNGLRATLHLQHWQGCGNPIGGLTLSKDGNFYGTTIEGGYDFGTVFKMTAKGELTYIFAFNETNGSRSLAELAQDAQGNLYGTTEEDGPNGKPHGGYGTVFKINPAGKLLWCVGFNGTNGLHPTAGLAMGPDGSFYGSTYGGWYTGPDGNQTAQNEGTIFKITTNGVLITLVSFGNTNGACPVGRLVLASDGNFYGAVRFLNGVGMASDSPMGNGAVFKISPAGKYRIVATFDNGDFNAGPAGGLTEALDGDLYGVTGGGGSNHQGTVFKVRVGTRHFADPAPLRAALSKLNAKVPQWSATRFSPVPMFGDNSVTAYFTDFDSGEWEITAKAYDSEAAAKAGLENDQRWVFVNWNEKQIIGGVETYAYTNYGRVDFQAGPYTFVVNTIRHGNENVQPLLRKVCSVLIGEFKR